MLAAVWHRRNRSMLGLAFELHEALNEWKDAFIGFE